ncbi:serine protease [Candidatus Parcubacteria bacterium]|nr:serine protease [Candidatus Parcubacteria bacterium]
MNFVDSLLASLVGFVVTAITLASSTLSSFLPPPPQPIVITPSVEEHEPILVKNSAANEQPAKAETKSESKLQLDVNGLARSAVVNILCTGNSKIRTASGSGIVIDPRGVILTNAHIGQFFLLHDYPTKNSVNCVVRTGSPATPAYYATLLFLPPTWIDANAQKITAEEATGSGKNDYTFLLVTSLYDGSPVPPFLPSISYTTEEPDSGDPMLLAAYPSASLSNKTIFNNLHVTSTFTIVKKLYSYTPPTHVDLFSIGSTTISEGGASGGAAVRASDGKVMGLITLASNAEEITDRDLRALSLAYINRSLVAEHETGIAQLLSGDLHKKAEAFEKFIAPDETKELVDQLEQKH